MTDYRDRARGPRADGLCPDHDRMVLVDTFDTFEGDELSKIPAELPATYEVCSTCDGKGKHVHPGIDAHGLGADDFAADPGFAEQYHTGVYDVTCYGCKGRRVMLVVDRTLVPAAVLAELDGRAADHYEHLAEVEAERRMGC